MSDLRKLAEDLSDLDGAWGTEPSGLLGGYTSVRQGKHITVAHCFREEAAAFISAASPAVVLGLLGRIDEAADLRERMSTYMNSLPKPYFSPAVVLGDSAIEGGGLFARRDIEAGEILSVERGPIVDRQFVEMVWAMGFAGDLCVDWGKYSLHGPVGGGQGGYINHSCAPNAGLIAPTTWAAIRPIAAGEEICCDYGTFETGRDWKMECRCGSPECRGTITARDWRLPILQARMGRWYAPYLKRRAEAEIDECPSCHQREGNHTMECDK